MSATLALDAPRSVVPFGPATRPASPFDAIGDPLDAVSLDTGKGAPVTEQWPQIVEQIVTRALGTVEARLGTIETTATGNAGAIAGIKEGLAAWRGADLSGRIEKLEARLEAEAQRRVDGLVALDKKTAEVLKLYQKAEASEAAATVCDAAQDAQGAVIVELTGKVGALEAERHRLMGAFFILSSIPTVLTVVTAALGFLGWFAGAAP